jgi:hypothetical protein
LGYRSEEPRHRATSAWAKITNDFGVNGFSRRTGVYLQNQETTMTNLTPAWEDFNIPEVVIL